MSKSSSKSMKHSKVRARLIPFKCAPVLAWSLETRNLRTLLKRCRARHGFGAQMRTCDCGRANVCLLSVCLGRPPLVPQRRRPTQHQHQDHSGDLEQNQHFSLSPPMTHMRPRRQGAAPAACLATAWQDTQSLKGGLNTLLTCLRVAIASGAAPTFKRCIPGRAAHGCAF